MYYPYLILLLLGVVRCHEINDLDAIVATIFGTSTTPKDNEGTPSTVGLSIATRDAENNLTCITPDNKVGECVSYYLCDPENSTIITDGFSVIDISPDNGCAGYMDTCCLVGPVDASETPNVASSSEGHKLDIPEIPKPNANESKSIDCGRRNPNGVGLVTNNVTQNQAQFGEFPWTVSIFRLETLDDYPSSMKINVYRGGGSLIHPSVVLATAYLVANSSTLKVRAGVWDMQNTKESYPYQDRDVASVVVHEDFNSGNLHNDIAVLFLAEPVDMAPNVGVVCLPPPRMETPRGTRCIATGWGKDQYGYRGRYMNIMKKIEVPVVDDSTCVKRLQGTSLGRFFQLHSSFMCAGGELNQDTCKGDGGSPLVCPIQTEPGHYMETGIVSWGIGCGKDGIPGVYTDVAKFRNWIDDKVREKGYDTNVYTI